tara:strand:+ start:2735 stop:2905 length:171 start_codon:yes stop_codon:yes gene_type:complete
MKIPDNGEDGSKQRKSKKEKSKESNGFVDENGMKYKKVFNGHMGIYVWEITRSKDK